MALNSFYNMIVKYKVEGTIEVELNDDDLEEFESHKSETMKKAYLDQLLTDKFWACSLTTRHEFGHKINFEKLFTTKNEVLDKLENENKDIRRKLTDIDKILNKTGINNG